MPLTPPNTSDLSRFAICRAATRRARMIWAGAPLLRQPTSLKPCRMALDEVRAGAVAFSFVRVSAPHELHVPEPLTK